MSPRSMPAGDQRPEPVIDDLLAADLVELRAHVAERRLRMFREFTTRRVRLASPLLLDVCRPGELDDAAWRMRPNDQWPLMPVSLHSIRGWSAKASAKGPYRVAVSFLDQDPIEVADRLTLRVTDRSAHMTLVIGRGSIRTMDTGGDLMLPGLMPREQRDVLVGGPLDRVVRHPAVSDRPYVIGAASVDERRNRTLLRFAAAPVEWRMPWARPWESFR